MGLFDGIGTKGARAAQEQPLDEKSLAILDIERKMKSLEQASQIEISALKANVAEECRKVGAAMHMMYVAENIDIENVKGLLDGITGLTQVVREKEAKLSEILARYTEELQILRPLPADGQAFCTNCGTAYIVGEDAFCENCGNNLKMLKTKQAFCINCGTPYTPGFDEYCSNCRAKLD